MRSPIGIPLIVRNVKITGPRGSVNVDLILDSGATFTTLPPSILTLVGYDIGKITQREEIITANGAITVPKLQVMGLAVGDISAKDIEVICHDIPQLLKIEGLLGLSFLKYFKTTMDYKNGYLEIV